MPNRSEDSRYLVPPVERALKLLRYIAEGNSCHNFSIVARDLQINRTTLIRLVHTLETHRMIEATDDQAGYRLGSGLVSLGAQAMHGRDIVRVCQPLLRSLCNQTGMSAHLGILDGRDVIYLARETPNAHLVSNIRAGSRLPAHGSSIGRAILARMPEAEINSLFAAVTLEKISPKTPQSCAQIILQAEQDRKRGFAWSEGNFESGIGSCAAVILDHTGQPAGGINVSGPQTRFARVNGNKASEISAAVLAAAEQASSALGYSQQR